jgi:hypothetical protein
MYLHEYYHMSIRAIAVSKCDWWVTHELFRLNSELELLLLPFNKSSPLPTILANVDEYRIEYELFVVLFTVRKSWWLDMLTPLPIFLLRSKILTSLGS